MKAAIYNGSRLTVSINGHVIAAGHVANYSIMTSSQEIETLDIVTPVELVPTRIRVSMTMQVYRLPENDPVANDIAPGDNFGGGTTEQLAFTQMRYIDVDIRDDLDRSVFRIPRAQLTSRSGSVQVGNFLTESWSIQGIGYSSSLK